MRVISSIFQKIFADSGEIINKYFPISVYLVFPSSDNSSINRTSATSTESKQNGHMEYDSYVARS